MSEADSLDLDAVQAYLKLPRALLLRLAESGKIPCRKEGEEFRFRKAEIDRWLERIESGEGETLTVEDI